MYSFSSRFRARLLSGSSRVATVECAADASATVQAGVVSVDPSIEVSGLQDGQTYTFSSSITEVTGTTAYTTVLDEGESSLTSSSPVKIQLDFAVQASNPSDEVSCQFFLELTEGECRRQCARRLEKRCWS